jgi:signal transduction histidine kinase
MMLTPLTEDKRKIDTESRTAIKESLDLIGELSKEVRTISHLLHPPLLDEIGLSSALRMYLEGFAERSKIKMDLEVPSDLGRFPQEIETAIFRVVQECVTNIHRHSGSTVARVCISQINKHVRIEIQDSGKGISQAQQSDIALGKAGVGIRGMKERVRQLGGSLKIDSQGEGKGTSVVAELPVEKTSAPNDGSSA